MIWHFSMFVLKPIRYIMGTLKPIHFIYMAFSVPYWNKEQKKQSTRIFNFLFQSWRVLVLIGREYSERCNSHSRAEALRRMRTRTYTAEDGAGRRGTRYHSGWEFKDRCILSFVNQRSLYSRPAWYAASLHNAASPQLEGVSYVRTYMRTYWRTWVLRAAPRTTRENKQSATAVWARARCWSSYIMWSWVIGCFLLVIIGSSSYGTIRGTMAGHKIFRCFNSLSYMFFFTCLA